MDLTCVENVEPIAKSVFSTMLSLELERLPAPPARFEPKLQATVQITGNWLGSVTLLFTETSIVRAAQAMLCAGNDPVSEPDQRDVAAELVNMIGGNFKSLLQAPVHLSLPSTHSGEHLKSEVHHATLIDSMAFDFEGECMQILVHESNA